MTTTDYYNALIETYPQYLADITRIYDMSTNNVKDFTGKLEHEFPVLELNMSGKKEDVDIKSIEYVVKRLDSMCEKYLGVKPDEVRRKTRKREVVFARQIYHTICKTHTGASLSEIGQLIGGKDHATVLHSIKTVKNIIDTDKKAFNVFKQINNML